MNDADLTRAREAAEKAARAAADVVRDFSTGQGRRVLRDKGLNELVTEADVAAQRAIVAVLEGVVPGAAFLGEEENLGQGKGRQGLRWIIDPIDGTTNFTRGVPPYAVSIGLVDGDRPLVGVVLDVPHDELFSAAQGQGLLVNGEKVGVSATEALADSLIATGFPYRDFDNVDVFLATLAHFFGATRGVRRHGAASIDLAWVACGRFDAFFETGLSPWDVAAGLCLVQEGGGRCTTFGDGGSALFDGQLLASNGRLHAPMRDALAPLRGVRT